MLDIKLELGNYQPIRLEAVEESSGELPENIKEAINLFNKALEDARFGNEDMAIIALKKAISLHPGFYEAMNLLGICYAAIGKDDMAEFAFRQVIDADDSSIKALEYLNKMKGLAGETDRTEITPVKKKSKTVKTRPQESRGSLLESAAKGLQKEDNNIYGLKYIAGIMIGVVLVLFIWLMVPTNKSLFSVVREEKIIKDPELEKQIAQLNEKIKNLEVDLQASNEEKLRVIDSFESYKAWSGRLEQAEAEFSAGNIVQAAELLVNTQGQIPTEFAAGHKKLWDKVRVQAANQLYQEANKIYDGNTAKDAEVYKQALEKFESAITYLENDRPNYMPNLYYQAGKAAARCDEMERAVELFEAIISQYPTSQYSSYASVRLREISEGKAISGN